MGVKMFAWLGGVAMFFGVIFFVKYAFERNLIPPAVRVALGFVTGAGLLAGGLATHRKEAYRVLAQAFCATGMLILYGVSYAAHAVYHFPAFGPWLTFGLMAMITAAAILIAVRLDAAGGRRARDDWRLPRANPAAQRAGQHVRPGQLHRAARHRLAGRGRQRPLAALAAGAAIGTAITQIAWFAQFFTHGHYHEGARTYVPMGLALFFIALFLAAAWMTRKNEDNRAGAATGAGLGLAGAGGGVCLCLPYLPGDHGPSVPALRIRARLERRRWWRPCWTCPAFSRLYPPATAVTFLHLGLWTAWRLKPDLFGSALAVFLVFGAVHACLPLLWRRSVRWPHPRPSGSAAPWLPLAPLLLTLTAVLSLPHTSWLLWPAVLLVDLLALAVAAVTGTLIAVPVALVLSLVVAGAWLLGEPADAAPLPILLGMILAFAGIFAAVGGWLARRAATANPARADASRGGALAGLLWCHAIRLAGPGFDAPASRRIPRRFSGWPCCLVLLLLGLAVRARQAALPLVALACVLAVEACWHGNHFDARRPMVSAGLVPRVLSALHLVSLPVPPPPRGAR